MAEDPHPGQWPNGALRLRVLVFIRKELAGGQAQRDSEKRVGEWENSVM